MSRREFITLVGGTAVWPLVAQAQQPERMRRIGVLLAANADDVDLSFGVGWSDLPRATAEGPFDHAPPARLFPRPDYFRASFKMFRRS